MNPKTIANTILNAIFPPRCMFCGKVLGFAKTCACGGEDKLHKLDEQALPKPELECECYVENMWAATLYKDTVRQMIIRYKFEGEKELAPFFTQLLVKAFHKNNLAENFDLIVPSPVSKKTIKKRGYNQSALIAKALAKQVGLPFAEILHKVVNTTPQMMLNREKRLVNLQNTFEADSSAVSGARVLIIDDIITTGSTLNEGARALCAAGAATCSGLAIAYTQF